jgi:hypothetical protein
MIIRAASEGMLELTEALLDGNADIETADAVSISASHMVQ